MSLIRDAKQIAKHGGRVLDLRHRDICEAACATLQKQIADLKADSGAIRTA